MILKKLSLTNYKSIDAFELNFNPSINCFVGDNGVGKSNILDAIYHLSFCKSYFNSAENHNINHGKNHFMIKIKHFQKVEKIN